MFYVLFLFDHRIVLIKSLKIYLCFWSAFSLADWAERRLCKMSSPLLADPETEVDRFFLESSLLGRKTYELKLWEVYNTNFTTKCSWQLITLITNADLWRLRNCNWILFLLQQIKVDDNGNPGWRVHAMDGVFEDKFYCIFINRC